MTSKRGLILIGGEGRSGSTMLDLMLGHGAEAFSCGEVYAWFRPWRTHHRRIVCSCGDDPCPIWDRIKDVPEYVFHAHVIDRLNVRYVVDSSKELTWIINAQSWARASGVSVLNLMLWKTPEEMAWSQFKRGRSVESWVPKYLQYYRRVLDIGLPFVSIAFRDLVERPAETVKRICAVAGLDYFTGKENFWEHHSHHLFGSSGTRAQRERGIAEVRSNNGFSAEFVAGLPDLSAKLASTPGLTKMVDALRRRDVFETVGPMWHRFEAPLLKPAWYYERRLKRAYRRIFPQRWEFMQ